MLDELSQYGTNLTFMHDIWHGEQLYSRMLVRVYTPEDYEGFKALYGEDDKPAPVFTPSKENIPF